MADNTKIWPIFRWANGGLSDDLFTGIRNSFYYSDKIEIRQNSKAIYPARWVDYQWEKVSWKPVEMLYHGWKWYIFTDSWTIYKSDLYSTTTQLATGINFWEIYDAEIFGDYFFFTSDKWLFQISTSAADADWSNLDPDNPLYALTSWFDYYPLRASDSLLAIGNGNELKKVTLELQTLVQDWFALPAWYEIRFIDELWYYLRVSIDDGFYWSEVALWDKISTYPSEVIPLAWYRIYGSIIFQWYHYLLSDKWLWLLNWYQFYTLKKLRIWSTKVCNCMCVHDEKLYINLPWSDWTTEGIYIYWAKNKNYNDVLAQQRSWNYWCVASNGSSFVVAKKDAWSTYELWELTSTVPRVWWQINDEWELWTMAYFGNSLSEIKQSMYLRVWYEIPTWWNIKIYYRTEADWYWLNPAETVVWHELTKPEWLYADWDMRSPFATSLKLNCRFQWIQFKFVLKQWTANSYKNRNTYLYSADLYYNDMLD